MYTPPVTPATPAVPTVAPATPAVPAAKPTTPSVAALTPQAAAIQAVRVQLLNTLIAQLKALIVKAQQQGITLPPGAVAILNAGPVSAPAAAVPSSSSVPPSGSFSKYLATGSSNSDVTALQRFLTAQGPSVYPEGTVSGYYGALTRKAVGKFQEKNGIAKPGDAGYGTVGPKTRAKINQLLGL